MAVKPPSALIQPVMVNALTAEGASREAEYAARNSAEVAFVATNSVNQGAQVHQLWPRIFTLGIEISFAHKDFKWSNNATNNAAVICSIIGLRLRGRKQKTLFENGLAREVECIGPYLVPGNEIVIQQALSSKNQADQMRGALSELYEGWRNDLVRASALVEACLTRYVSEAGLVGKDFATGFALMAAQRHARIIGLFVRLLKRDGKPEYLQHLPRVWRMFERALRHEALQPLRTWVDRLLPPERRRIGAE
jgi:hypothetical protein